MDNVRIARELAVIARDLVAANDTAEDWKLKFPSHALTELNKAYDKLGWVTRDMRRSDDDKVKEASREMSRAMGSFVNLLAQLKNAETMLYRK